MKTTYVFWSAMTMSSKKRWTSDPAVSELMLTCTWSFAESFSIWNTSQIWVTARTPLTCKPKAGPLGEQRLELINIKYKRHIHSAYPSKVSKKSLSSAVLMFGKSFLAWTHDVLWVWKKIYRTLCNPRRTCFLDKTTFSWLSILSPAASTRSRICSFLPPARVSGLMRTSLQTQHVYKNWR